MKYLSLLLFTLGCGPAGPLTDVSWSGGCPQHPCGVQFFVKNCESVTDILNTSLDALETYTGAPKDKMCKNLNGWAISSRNGSWESEGDTVIGVSYCWIRAIETSPESMKSGTLTHELFHAWQMCDANPPDDCSSNNRDLENGCMHWHWKELGVIDAVNEAQIKYWTEDM